VADVCVQSPDCESTVSLRNKLKGAHSSSRRTRSNCKKVPTGTKESSLAFINYRGLSTWGQVHKVHTKGSKYLTELHGEAGPLNKFERQKDDKLLLYP